MNEFLFGQFSQIFKSLLVFNSYITMSFDSAEYSKTISEHNDTKCDTDQGSKALFKFRNYTSQTNFLDGLYTVDKAQPGSIAEYIEEKIKLISDKEYLIDGGEHKYKINPEKLNLQKIDADLKRRIEGRLEKLESETRTQINKHLKSQRNKNR